MNKRKEVLGTLRDRVTAIAVTDANVNARARLIREIDETEEKIRDLYSAVRVMELAEMWEGQR